MSEIDEKTIDLNWLSSLFDRNKYLSYNEIISFDEYLQKVEQNPRLCRTAYQRLYDMILSKGTKPIKIYRKTYTHYNFFDDPNIPIFGLDETLDAIVKFIRGAAGCHGTEKRILLLHGPVGSSKSTICRLLKKGLEEYSRTEDGAWYTYKWVNLPSDLYTSEEDECPMNDDPIKLIPLEMRHNVLSRINSIFVEQSVKNGINKSAVYPIRVDGELNPRCKKFMSELLKRYSGDWKKVIDTHIKVIRKVHSEADRVGIATFQPKDEKNQDATELTGDINYSKLPHFGVDSDPRAFNFDGEFCVANRGFCEFIEMLKLDKAFLYDLLGASQERSIKPKKFSQVSIDEAIIGHSNMPEFKKLKDDQTMEALRDRTVKIDVPYLLKLSDEIKVLMQDYAPNKVNQHIAPHTIEIVAFWLILTRLKDGKEPNLSLVDKVKLYDGKFLPGYTEDRVKELRDKYEGEGMDKGVSVRFAQDKISNCLSSHHDYINPFMVLNEIKEGLSNSALLNKEDVSNYITCAELALKELSDILKNEVQKALVGDEEAIVRLCTNYIDNVVAYIYKTKIVNPYTGREQEPDEKLMRSIEEKINVPETGADDYRRSVATFIGAQKVKGLEFKWDSDPELKKALEAKLFEDTKDHIKLSALNSSGATVVDPTIQEKIDAIKQRLIKNFGYNDKSAEDVLNYVSSLFARGDSVED
jgi:serine protein kinase